MVFRGVFKKYWVYKIVFLIFNIRSTIIYLFVGKIRPIVFLKNLELFLLSYEVFAFKKNYQEK